jgi:putative hydrolase of the HAD superfamily
LNNPTVTAVIFDLGNVLVRFDPLLFGRRFAAQSDRTPEQLREFFLRSPLIKEYDAGRLSSAGFYDAVCRELGFRGTFAEFAAYWTEIFEPIDEMLALAMSLKGKLPRVMLSNTNELHLDYLRKNYPVLEDFDGHVFSCKIGLLKPDAPIYEYALRQYGLRGATTVFIDDLAPNVAGAQAAGLQAFQYQNPAQVRQELTKLGVPFI